MVDGERDKGLKSICMTPLTGYQLAAIEQEDLVKLETFNICRGCALRYNLLGYKTFYTKQLALNADRDQLALF